MLLNYLKLSIKVLGRKKFYTFISLFGISITLMILMVMVSVLDNELGTHAPMSNDDRSVYVPRGVMKLIMPDTSYVVDTLMRDGVEVYDSTMNIGERTSSTSSSSVGYPLLDKYLRDVPYVEECSFYSPDQSHDVFINSKKLVLEANYTDAAYWRVFEFEFIEGRPFRDNEVETRSPVVVINEETRDDYFGKGVNALGQDIEIEKKSYEVIGVIKDPGTAKSWISANVYIPVTHLRADMIKGSGGSFDYLGSFEGVFMGANNSDVSKIKDEINRKAELIPMPNPDEYNNLRLLPRTTRERFALAVAGDNNDDDDMGETMLMFYVIISTIIVLFILLPTLNLININITRIMERSSEIGVRKAFGAKSWDLLLQFVFENVILTLIGGALGLLGAYWLINILNDSGVFMEMKLKFHTSVFLYAILVTLFFGIISGLLPAYRMSKLHVVKALKQNAL